MGTESTCYDFRDFGVANGSQLVSWDQHYRLDDQKIAAGLGTRIDERAADLLDIAAALYVTDRLSPRHPYRARNDGTWWSRRLAVRVAVRDQAFWRRSDIHEQVVGLAEWLTDDFWAIDFAKQSQRRYSETQSHLFPEQMGKPLSVGLFSGGLDSLLGAAAELRDEGGELVLVAASTHSRLLAKQRELATGLEQHGPRRLRAVFVPVGLTSAGKALRDRAEETQRTRGFVFLALGAAVASAAQVDELRLYENGPGALNLPLTAAQRGSMNTRAARPETLSRMSALLSEVRGESFRVINPLFWKTKGESCAEASAAVHSLMAASVSCDTGLTRRKADAPLCGRCTSCLLRRQALLAAGLKEIDRSDLCRMDGDALSAPIHQANPMVLAMLDQTARIDHAVASADPWDELVVAFPGLPSARRSLDVAPTALVDLFRRYVSDWRRLSQPLVRAFLGDRRTA